MNAREVMTRTPLSVTPRTTIGQAWEALKALDVRHLPVINEDRELIGILSDRDFGVPPAPRAMEELLGEPHRRLDQPVSTIMSGDPISVDADADVREVLDLMVENKIGAVPVISPEGHVVGIVSYLDLLRRLSDTLD